MNDQDKITFYSGMNTIGGVQIVYGYKELGFVFDLGLSMGGLFNEYVKTTPPLGARHYMLTRSAPPLLNLYSSEAMQDVTIEQLQEIWKRQELPQYNNLKIFISHIHQDHMALLPYVAEGTPIYMSKDAYAVYRAVVASGEYGDTQGRIIALEDLQEIALDEEGKVRLKIIEVDHDTPGCSGFILKTASGTKIGFTADWRRHGRHSYRMDRFIELCRNEGVEVLITEGTRLRPNTLFRQPEDRLEADVAVRYREVTEQAAGLVYVNILGRNVERVADIILATKEAGRTLVMDASTAALWYEATRIGISALAGNAALTLAEEVIRVLPTLNSLSVDSSITLPYRTISLSEVTANKALYCVYLPYNQLPLMAELECLGDRSQTSHYVHADGNPLTSNDETLHRWLTEFGVQYHYFATGGHAAPQEISDLTARIRPKVVIPLHSVHPTLFDSRSIPRFYPVYGETVQIDKLLDHK
ncbi:MBL fold metallo-hydrolase [Paenibacillus sp. YSY-4.3]